MKQTKKCRRWIPSVLTALYLASAGCGKIDGCKRPPHHNDYLSSESDVFFNDECASINYFQLGITSDQIYNQSVFKIEELGKGLYADHFTAISPALGIYLGWAKRREWRSPDGELETFQSGGELQTIQAWSEENSLLTLSGSSGWKGMIAETGIRLGNSLEDFLAAYPDAQPGWWPHNGNYRFYSTCRERERREFSYSLTAGIGELETIRNLTLQQHINCPTSICEVPPWVGEYLYATDNLSFNEKCAGLGHFRLGMGDAYWLGRGPGFVFLQDRYSSSTPTIDIINNEAGIYMQWKMEFGFRSGWLQKITLWSSSPPPGIEAGYSYEGWKGQITESGISLGSSLEQFLAAYPLAEEASSPENTSEYKYIYSVSLPQEPSSLLENWAYVEKLHYEDIPCNRLIAVFNEEQKITSITLEREAEPCQRRE